MSVAEYRAAFGQPMSDEDRKAIEERNQKIVDRWHLDIKPNLVMRKTFAQWLRLLFVSATEVAVPRDAELPECQMLTMGGFPLHVFKRHGGRWFYEHPVYSPGFPGS